MQSAIPVASAKVRAPGKATEFAFARKDIRERRARNVLPDFIHPTRMTRRVSVRRATRRARMFALKPDRKAA